MSQRRSASASSWSWRSMPSATTLTPNSEPSSMIIASSAWSCGVRPAPSTNGFATLRMSTGSERRQASDE